MGAGVRWQRPIGMEMLDKLRYGETGLKFDFHDMAKYFCDMFLIKKIYLPTLRPIIADSYWAINSIFSTSFAIITDETQIFHPPWYFPCSWFLDRGYFIQWKITGEKSTGTNRGNFSSLDKIYHENVTKFQLSPLSLFLEGGKEICHTSHYRHFEEGRRISINTAKLYTLWHLNSEKSLNYCLKREGITPPLKRNYI